VQKPVKIICVAHNFHDFLKELGMKPHPITRIFSKFANAVAAGRSRHRPKMKRQLGDEAEHAFVVGKRCKKCQRQGYEFIAGYMTFNDISASDCTRPTSRTPRARGSTPSRRWGLLVTPTRCRPTTSRSNCASTARPADLEHRDWSTT
jgi:2-keto-4-pentenoate hydratase/2-oxohepta-3-ene-1,7-dioic acid hydratase in catechol pathway